MTALKNAPLIYTVGMIQFPRVPDFDQFTDKFFNLIRADYPLDEQVIVPVFNANITSEGVKVNQHEAKFWQFASIERDWAFVITAQALYLHTIKYLDSNDFFNRFSKGLNAFLTIPDIGIQWVNSIGLRYVDIIESKKGEDIKKYIKGWILPVEPPKVSQTPLTIIEGVYIARYKTESGEMRLQTMRNPPFTLPPELNTPLIIKNNWIKERPKTDFVLVDTDHFHKCEPPKKIEVDIILNELHKLQKVSKQVFSSIGTNEAKKDWKG